MFFTFTLYKVSVFGVFSGPYFFAFGLNMEIFKLHIRTLFLLCFSFYQNVPAVDFQTYIYLRLYWKVRKKFCISDCNNKEVHCNFQEYLFTQNSCSENWKRKRSSPILVKVQAFNRLHLAVSLGMFYEHLWTAKNEKWHLSRKFIFT